MTYNVRPLWGYVAKLLGVAIVFAVYLALEKRSDR